MTVLVGSDLAVTSGSAAMRSATDLPGCPMRMHQSHPAMALRSPVRYRERRATTAWGLNGTKDTALAGNPEKVASAL